MLQRTSNYGSLSWIDALAARDKPKDLEAELASAVETPNENVLEETAAIAFGTTATNETKNEALVRASREIQAKEAESNLRSK